MKITRFCWIEVLYHNLICYVYICLHEHGWFKSKKLFLIYKYWTRDDHQSQKDPEDQYNHRHVGSYRFVVSPYKLSLGVQAIVRVIWNNVVHLILIKVVTISSKISNPSLKKLVWLIKHINETFICTIYYYYTYYCDL